MCLKFQLTKASTSAKVAKAICVKSAVYLAGRTRFDS